MGNFSSMPAPLAALEGPGSVACMNGGPVVDMNPDWGPPMPRGERLEEGRGEAPEGTNVQIKVHWQ